MLQYFTIFKSDGDVDQVDCQIEYDPNVCEMPLDGVNQAFSSEGLKFIGWTAFIKVSVPSFIANFLITSHMAKKHLLFPEKSIFSKAFKEWWIRSEFSPLATGWAGVMIAHMILFFPLEIFFLSFISLGMFQSWLAFYIEHFLSNLNWLVYGLSSSFLFSAVITQNDWRSWLSAVVYSLVAYELYAIDFYYGTDAIRYLNNGFWADPHLYPSIFYWIGMLEHKSQPENKRDGSQKDDIPLEGIDTLLIQL